MKDIPDEIKEERTKHSNNETPKEGAGERNN